MNQRAPELVKREFGIKKLAIDGNVIASFFFRNFQLAIFVSAMG